MFARSDLSGGGKACPGLLTSAHLILHPVAEAQHP